MNRRPPDYPGSIWCIACAVVYVVLICGLVVTVGIGHVLLSGECFDIGSMGNG